MSRPAPDMCEVCGKAPPISGVGFPAYPKTLPGLPYALLGGCLWVCANPDCDLTAQKRASTAAAKGGVHLKQIWRHTLIRRASDTHPERTPT